MTVIINGTTGVTSVNGSAAAPSVTGTDTDTGIVYGTNTITLATNGTAGLTQNASQNIGTGGLTPSTWSAGKALEIGYAGTGIWSFSAVENYSLMNAYYNGGWKYASSAPASYYNQYNSGHYFASAPSGTSGNAITFTQTLVWGKDTTVALQAGSSNAGTGISFPATQYASSDANTLDDYEEGTWTPAFATSGGGFSTTYNSATGQYVKVGKLVTLQGNIIVGTKSASGSGYLVLTGLPFQMDSSTGVTEFGGSVGMSYLWASNPCICIQPSSGATTCILNYTFTNLNNTGGDIANGCYFRFSITYRAQA